MIYLFIFCMLVNIANKQTANNIETFGIFKGDRWQVGRKKEREIEKQIDDRQIYNIEFIMTYIWGNYSSLSQIPNQ